MLWTFFFFYLGNVIKSSKELVEHSNQLFRRTGTSQLCESHNVCIQDATQRKQAQILLTQSLMVQLNLAEILSIT